MKRLWRAVRICGFALWIGAVGTVALLWVLDREDSRLHWHVAEDQKSAFAAESYSGHILLFYGRLPDGVIYEALSNPGGKSPHDVYIGWKDPQEEITRHTAIDFIRSRGQYGHLWPYSTDRWPFISFPWDDGYLHVAYGQAPVQSHGSVSDRVVWFHLIVPNWLLLVVFGGIPGIIFAGRGIRYALRRRYAIGCCEKCGYDLRASSDKCPECGTPIPKRSESTKATPSP